jgi:hypothetical protein
VLWTDDSDIWTIGMSFIFQHGTQLPSAPMHTLNFTDCDVLHYDLANPKGPVAIIRGNPRQRLEHVHFRNIRVNHEGQAAFLEIVPWPYTGSPYKEVGSGGVGWPLPTWPITTPINDVTFTDIFLTGYANGNPGKIIVNGPDTASPVSNVTYTNVVRHGVLTQASSPGVQVTGYTSGIVFNGTAPTFLAPTVSLSTNGTSFQAPASIVLSASASDSDGTVTRVDFYRGTTLIGTDTTSPYAFTWASVAAGTYVLTAKATDNLGAIGSSNSVNVTVATGLVPPPTQAPYGGTARTIPGTIEAEHYDVGGASIAYHDTTAGNSGRALRADSVDIYGGYDGGTIIGATKAGEWLEYTVHVATAGNYTLEARVSSVSSGGRFHVEFNGVDKTGAIIMPAASGTLVWKTLTQTVSLAAGQQVMKLAFDTNGTGHAFAEVANVNYIRLTAQGAPAAQTPFGGTARAIPGVLMVSQYDNGGEGVAYHDVDAANLSSSTYRPGLAVDSSGQAVEWIKAGEWLEYTINVSASGSHVLSIPLAHPGTGGTLHLEVGGVRSTTLTAPNTGSWSVFQNRSLTVNLNAGVQVLRIAFDSNGSTGFVCNLGNITLSRSLPTGSG